MWLCIWLCSDSIEKGLIMCEFDDRSDEMYERWRDERDDRSFLQEENLPDASKELKCTKCGNRFIGHKNRSICRDCFPHGVHNYPEDLLMKDGSYHNYCSDCEEWYVGHISRKRCKVCQLKKK